MITKKLFTIVVMVGAVIMAVFGTRPAAARTSMLASIGMGEETYATEANTSVLVIPASAFNPYVDGYDYENFFSLAHFHSQGGGTNHGFYYAPVNLPHGAVVTKFNFYWYDFLPLDDGYASLRRNQLITGNEEIMAAAATWYIWGNYSSEDDDIEQDTIDNFDYAYFVELNLPVSADYPDQVKGYCVSIEYVPPAKKTGVLSIPAAAFTPHEDLYEYHNYGKYLTHDHSPGGGTERGWYYAPVGLPQGAEVTRFTFYWDDESGADGKAVLQRTQLGAGDFKDMATAVTAGSAGNGSSYDDDIDFGNIINALYAYWVVWDLPYMSDIAHQLGGYGVVIEYMLPALNTGVLSIPAAAFTPYQGGLDFMNDGRYLRHNSGGSSSNGLYYAPVYLPQRASVTSMTFHWYDASEMGTATASLMRNSYYGKLDYLVGALSDGSAGYGSTPNNIIENASVDNSQYFYRMELTLPAGEDVKLCGVVIKYEYRLYLPLTFQ